MNVEAIDVERLSRAGAHYSHAVVAGGFVFISGQLPIVSPADPRPVDGGVKAQARQALRNIEAVLSAAGSALDRVVSTTIYLTSIDDWSIVNEVYAATFGSHRPARAIVACSELHFGCRIEIQAIAVLS